MRKFRVGDRVFVDFPGRFEKNKVYIISGFTKLGNCEFRNSHFISNDRRLTKAQGTIFHKIGRFYE